MELGLGAEIDYLEDVGTLPAAITPTRNIRVCRILISFVVTVTRGGPPITKDSVEPCQFYYRAASPAEKEGLVTMPCNLFVEERGL